MAAGLDAVRRICEGWPTLTVEQWRELCTPEVVYINMPWRDVITVGPDAIHRVLSQFSARFDIGLAIEQLGGDESLAFAERTEHFVPKAGEAGETFDLPVNGVFELSDGKVSAWRDYFDRRAMRT